MEDVSEYAEECAGLDASEYAEEHAGFYLLADSWLIASPDDPAMRRYLIDDESLPPAFADAVLAKMRKLGSPTFEDVPAYADVLDARFEAQ